MTTLRKMAEEIRIKAVAWCYVWGRTLSSGGMNIQTGEVASLELPDEKHVETWIAGYEAGEKDGAEAMREMVLELIKANEREKWRSLTDSQPKYKYMVDLILEIEKLGKEG